MAAPLISLQPAPGRMKITVHVSGADAVFTCDQVGTADMEVYAARASRLVDEMESGLGTADMFGFLSRRIDFTDPDERSGLLRMIMIQELAVDKVKAWTGIAGPDGQPAELTPDNIRAVMRLHPVGQVFFSRLMALQEQRILAKNA